MPSSIRIFYNQIVCLVVAISVGVVLQVHASSLAVPIQAERVDLSAYLLPDGTLPVLCLFHGDGEDEQAQRRCPACTLAKAIDCGPGAQFFTHAAFQAVDPAFVQTEQFVPQAHWTLFRSRGPPRA